MLSGPGRGPEQTSLPPVPVLALDEVVVVVVVVVEVALDAPPPPVDDDPPEPPSSSPQADAIAKRRAGTSRVDRMPRLSTRA